MRQDRKRRRIQPVVTFLDDNLSSILDFIPFENHVAFALVSKQFYHVFSTSNNVVLSKMREFTDCLSSITPSEQLLLLSCMKKKIRAVEPSVKLNYANMNLYKTMKSIFGSKIIHWKPFLSHLVFESIHCTENVHHVMFHFKKNVISIEYATGEHRTFTVYYGGMEPITISTDHALNCCYTYISFDKLPMKEQYAMSEWVDMMLMLADFIFNERGLSTSRDIMDVMEIREIYEDIYEDDDDDDDDNDIYSTEIQLNQPTNQAYQTQQEFVNYPRQNVPIQLAAIRGGPITHTLPPMGTIGNNYGGVAPTQTPFFNTFY
jgi:hypothetical protein